MPIPDPNLSEARYQQLVDEALRRIPAHRPEWTNHNQSDPGVTLVELFAFLGDLLRYRSSRLPRTSRVLFRKAAMRLRRRRGPTLVMLHGGNRKLRSATAGFIADRLGLPLYRVNLSEVMSKCTGETEKNLRRVFDAAKADGAMLCFDEADVLLVKRSAVKSRPDQNATVYPAWLSQRIEHYKGLVILTTKRKNTLEVAPRRQFHCDVSRILGR